MPTSQTKLFADPQPLVERLGRSFFASLPEAPGVYLMLDGAGRVVYVGKAKNLRRRLCAYKVANPDRLPRRTLRLLHTATCIQWELCRDEAAALEREAILLLEKRPRFNRAGVWKASSQMLGWRVVEGTIEFDAHESEIAGWSYAPPMGRGSHALARRLVRLIWPALRPGNSILNLPEGWFAGRFKLPLQLSPQEPQAAALLSQYIACLVAGDLQPLKQWLAVPPGLFDKSSQTTDLEWLEDMFVAR
ncbi:MAG: nucleotide excision repair endonuclease [Verrucomicrobia bacterium]|nr:nucleotide excision repair endonuclease [Verrucomicrobiota bacterium]